MWRGCLLFVALSGCGGNRLTACEALTACVGLVNPFLMEETLAEYGHEGACLAGGDPEACQLACEDELIGLWSSSGAAACDPEPVTGRSVLSKAAFTEDYNALLCSVYESCTPERGCPEIDDVCYGGTFDPLAAERCLDEPAECVQGDGYAYVEPGEACRDLCIY